VVRKVTIVKVVGFLIFICIHSFLIKLLEDPTQNEGNIKQRFLQPSAEFPGERKIKVVPALK
jgi:hypothetical protein